MIGDFKYAVRMLTRAPVFTVVAVLTLALGIGANTAVFSVVKAVLIEPLPYHQPDRLLRLRESSVYGGKTGTGSVSVPNLEDWRERNTVFEDIGAYMSANFNLTDASGPVRLEGVSVTPALFRVLGVEPLLGRYFVTGESEAGRDRVVVLSYELWQSRFAGEADVVGRELSINGETHTVVGVMPRGFRFPAYSETLLWTPLVYEGWQLQYRSAHWVETIGRLKSGVTIEQARAEMAGIAKALEQEYPESNDQRGVWMGPLSEEVRGRVRSVLVMLWAAAGIVLLICCANVANLLLARATTRRRDHALRAALGASRGRLVRQSLAESLLLAVCGGALGVLLGVWGVDQIAVLPGTTVPVGADVSLDGRVLAFCLSIAAIAAVVSGLTPALRAARSDPQRELKAGGSRVAGLGHDRLRGALICGQVALSVVLLVSAGLLAKSIWSLQRVDTGLRPDHMLTLKIPLSGTAYESNEAVMSFYRRLVEETRSLPGVESAGIVNLLPLQSWFMNASLVIRGRPDTSPSDRPLAEVRVINPDYFRAAGIPLLAGRPLAEGDDPQRVVIINRELARRYWPDADPLGQQLRLAEGPVPEDVYATVVGVVGDVRGAGLNQPPSPVMYMPFAFYPQREMSLVVRTATEPASMTSAIRGVVQRLDPEQPVYLVKTMEQVVADSVARPRFNALLFALFAGLALALAIAGLYGVMSYMVARRSHEIGVRMALGARRSGVLGMVIHDGLRLVAIGLVVGLAGAFAVTRMLSHLLFEVTATDPSTFVAVALVLTTVAAAACWIPARRAARVDPVVALRYE